MTRRRRHLVKRQEKSGGTIVAWVSGPSVSYNLRKGKTEPDERWESSMAWDVSTSGAEQPDSPST